MIQYKKNSDAAVIDRNKIGEELKVAQTQLQEEANKKNIIINKELKASITVKEIEHKRQEVEETARLVAEEEHKNR